MAPFAYSKPSACGGRSYKECKANEIVQSPNFYDTEITPLVQAIQAGRATFSDSNCQATSFVESADILKATILTQDYYIVKNQTTINSHIFGASYCQRTNFTNNSIAIDCAAKEINAAVPPALTLSFYMEYTLTAQNPNTYVISKCPKVSQ